MIAETQLRIERKIIIKSRNRYEKTRILIFARYNSKRLPGKVLKEIFLEKKLLEVYLRLKKFTKLNIVVCTFYQKKIIKS